MRRALTVAAAVAASLCLALSVLLPAIAATGPFFIKTSSANSCLKVSPNAVGSIFTQGSYDPQRDCRKMFFSRAGFINGHPYGEIQTAGTPPLDLSAGGTCTDVFLSNHGATGTIWVQYITGAGERQYIINRHCNGVFGGGTNCVAALSGDGVIGHEWFIEPLGQPGWFQRMHWIQTSRAWLHAARGRVSSLHHRASALRHRVRAGC